jgi:hypothetical protein
LRFWFFSFFAEKHIFFISNKTPDNQRIANPRFFTIANRCTVDAPCWKSNLHEAISILSTTDAKERDTSLAQMHPASSESLDAAISEALSDLENAGILYFYSPNDVADATTTETTDFADTVVVLPLYDHPQSPAETLRAIRALEKDPTENHFAFSDFK